MNTEKPRHRHLTISFDADDLEFIDECEEILRRMHPDHHWCSERVVRLAVGTLWRLMTGEDEVTPGECLAASVPEPLPGDIIKRESLLDLLNERLGDDD